MQTRKDDNAFPVFDSEGLVIKGEDYCWDGLSKKEYFAAAALQGLLANPDITLGGAAKEAVRQANALIKALNENP